jgi:hypothetical protein
MKDFQKINKDSEWVALVNYQVSATEQELLDKDEKTEEDLDSLRVLHSKFVTAPTTDEVELLNKIYNNVLLFNDLTENNFDLQGAHITIENNKARGVINVITINGNEFKQMSI